MKIERIMIVLNHDQGENSKETAVTMDDGEDTTLTIVVKNGEAREIPVNARVKLTIDPITQ